jgi:hypothetical protein
MTLKFIGYCLQDISFQDKQLTEVLYLETPRFMEKHIILELNSSKLTLNS